MGQQAKDAGLTKDQLDPAGEWNFDGRSYGAHSVYHRVFAANGDCIAEVFDHGRGEVEANGRLIAATPTMFEALKAQEQAENEHANCPDCEGAGEWAECGRCSEFFGTAIELRRAALAKVQA